ncbi:MAG: hypothetical protein PHV33_13135 [Elusimicrobiales bacterium]|nr:hypothetical protein [Elusimicrobiales bacterium]
MSTTLKINGKTVTVDSDDRGLEERLARYAIEMVAGQPGAESGAGWNLARFIRRSGRHDSQKALLRELVEKGTMTRSEMVTAAGKTSGRELAGCRGSMSKNAIASKLPTDWWKDSWDHKRNDFVTVLREDVRAALKAALEQA